MGSRARAAWVRAAAHANRPRLTPGRHWRTSGGQPGHGRARPLARAGPGKARPPGRAHHGQCVGAPGSQARGDRAQLGGRLRRRRARHLDHQHRPPRRHLHLLRTAGCILLKFYIFLLYIYQYTRCEPLCSTAASPVSARLLAAGSRAYVVTDKHASHSPRQQRAPQIEGVSRSWAAGG